MDNSSDKALGTADADLVRRLRDGDGSAYEEVFDLYGDDLYGVAYSMLGNRADAEDAVQEALLGAFRRVAAFEGRSTLKTWLFRILFNRASKAADKRRVRAMASLDAPGPEPAGRGGAGGSPATAVEVKSDVATMLAALSPEHREVIVLRELQQFTYDEIAEALEIPVGTVESRLYRARQELKRRFEGHLS